MTRFAEKRFSSRPSNSAYREGWERMFVTLKCSACGASFVTFRALSPRPMQCEACTPKEQTP